MGSRAFGPVYWLYYLKALNFSMEPLPKYFAIREADPEKVVGAPVKGRMPRHDTKSPSWI